MFYAESYAIILVVASICYYNSLRGRHYLKRSAVVKHRNSPWAYLYRNADDISFFHMVGMSRATFEILMVVIFGEEESDKGRGRPPDLDRAGQLGLYLCFVGSTMTTKWLCLQFGILESTANVVINKMMVLVIKKLKRRPESKISFPTHEETVLWASLIHNREPSVNDVIGFVDGVALHIQCSDDPEEQSANHNVTLFILST